MATNAEAVSERRLVLGPKTAYWRAVAPFAVTAPVAAFLAILTADAYLLTDFRPSGDVIGGWVLLAIFGIGAVVFLPSVLASRKPGTFTVDETGVRFARGNREQRIRWSDMTEVTWGPRRVRLGKTSVVGEALRIRGSAELLPIDVDEILYRIDHAAWAETVSFVVDAARRHHAVVTTPASPEW